MGDAKLLNSHRGGHDFAGAAKLLATLKPGKVLLPSDPEFHRARSGLWSRQQSDVIPQCIFQPENAADVALVVTTAKNFAVPFAIKSGGHAAWTGASSSTGILIDLAKLNHVKLSKDGDAVHVGPGNRWVDVYTALEPLGITVIGGRDADVGVGGLILGGGISFFSTIHGWACDNVESFEVVLASGEIVIASPTQHPNLYKALRGGGPNFGVVTDFKLKAFPYEGMWGGLIVHEYKHIDRMLSALLNYGVNSDTDPKASFILNFGASEEGIWYFANDMQYCAPVAKAEFLKEYFDIPAVQDHGRIAHMSQHTVDLTTRTPRDWRNSYWGQTTKLNFDVMKYFIEKFVAEFTPIMTEVAAFHPAFCIQIITPGMLRNMKKNGGNVLGLGSSEEPLVLYNPALRWQDAADDDKVYRTIQRVLDKTVDKARELGVQNDFVYMNYAAQYQDVFTSYGADNVRFLQDVSRQYDPTQVFIRQQNFFKFDGPAKSW